VTKANGNENDTDLFLIYKHDAANFPYLKRELIYDIAKNKYYLYDKDSNKFYPSNFLGKKKIKINNNNLGKLSYKERLRNNLIEKLDKKIDDNSYHPKIKYFEGFSQLPRPLVEPFFNFNNDISRQNKKIIQSKGDMINYIRSKESRITDNKYKEILSRNNNNENGEKIKGLNYYSNSVAESINYKKRNINTNKVIRCINSSLSSGELSSKQKNSLKKFKNKILINSNNEIKLPNKIFKNKYKISSNVMLINPIKYSQPNHDSEINLNTYRILYSSINNNKLTKLIDSNKNQFELKRNKNEYNRYDRPNSVMNIRNDYKLFLPEKYHFKKSETKRTDTEENKKDNLNNKSKVHSLEDITKEFINEKNHINGFIKPIRKQNVILRKGNPKYKSGKELYKKELDLFKLVNPQKLKMEEDENEKRNNYLKRKIEKDRKIRIVKDKNIRAKGSRINSALSNLARDLNKDLNDYVD
jgi:hypothetical protein